MELKRVDMPPCSGRYYISRDGKKLYTTSTGNRHTVGKIEYAGITLYRLKELRPGSKGYCSVKVFDLDRNKRVQVGIHRMVAYAWGEPPKNYRELEIDHIDGNPRNNSIENLRWCSHKENIGYAAKRGAWHSWQSRRVLCLETNEAFGSVRAAFDRYKKPGQKSPSGLYECLSGRSETWHDMHFCYLSERSI